MIFFTFVIPKPQECKGFDFLDDPCAWEIKKPGCKQQPGTKKQQA